MYFLTSCVDLYSKYLTYQNITAILLADAMQLTTPENTITYHNASFLSPQNFFFFFFFFFNMFIDNYIK